jgi:hypothetical protein
MIPDRLAAVGAAFILLAAPAAAQSVAPSGLPSASPAASPMASPAGSPGASAAPVSAPTPTAAMTTQARTEYDALRAGKVDRTHYSSEMGNAISDERVANVAKQLQALGAVQRFAYERTVPVQGHTIYVYRVTCQKPPDLLEFIAWDRAGKIEALVLREASS